jgi:hypothetical protein
MRIARTAARGSLAIAASCVFVASARSEDALTRWGADVGIGYTHAEGDAQQAFGSGLEARLAVRHRGPFGAALEAGVALGDVGYAAARPVAVIECLPGPYGQRVACGGVAWQRGDTLSLTAGLGWPLHIDDRHALELSAGGLFSRDAVSHADYGTRQGWGYYGDAAVDLLPLGRDLRAALGARLSHVTTQGDSFGTPLAFRSADTWLDVTVRLRVGLWPVRH